MFSFLEQIISYLFPYSCIICSEQTKTMNLCHSCRSKLPLTREFSRPWIFSLYKYRENSVNECIKYIKKYPDNFIIESLIKNKMFMINEWIIGLTKIHQIQKITLVPIPIHRSRWLERGYNQALLIAQEIQKNIPPHLSIETRNDIIKKIKKTHKQALIKKREDRLHNELFESFIINKEINISHDTLIIIIDDVTTTGTTLAIAQKHLLQLSPFVYGFTLAH